MENEVGECKMPYNLSAVVGNATGGASLTQNVNSELVFGWLGVMLLLGITAVFFMAFYYRTGDIKVSMGSASWICLTFSILFRALGIITNLVVFILIILAALIMAVTWHRD